ncbi:DEAD/DEAH box helicase [Tistrella sp. BH-R2-4]|uniref:DEAD/DEAH box helicase n=1 Tax=Tistrella arctica TaxID=3133430 RepID=A0ABU9YHP3_9PROT
MTFEDLGLSAEVLRAVNDAGYTQPTPIQEKAIPWVLQGRDVLGCAQTGTGKTASFTLPMIDILAQGRVRARMPRSLIMTPTRELAQQIAESFHTYGQHTPLSMALLIGGMSFNDQEKALDKGVDVLIATPGRLLDHFERGRVLLTDVRILVVDEADRMLDMGFIPDLERIASLLPQIRQTLLFSATMPPEIRRLAGKFLMNPKEVSVAPQSTAAATVRQLVVHVANERAKRRPLETLMVREPVGNGIIFCNRKRTVATLYESLKRAGHDVGALHGDMTQDARNETLAAFRDNKIKFLIATDVAGRGLDIEHVSHVFNYDVPLAAEDYIHRIGRTGRAGRTGTAIMFVTPEDRKLYDRVVALLGGKAIETVTDLSGVLAVTGGAQAAPALAPDDQTDAETAATPAETSPAADGGATAPVRPARTRQRRRREPAVEEAAVAAATDAPTSMVDAVPAGSDAADLTDMPATPAQVAEPDFVAAEKPARPPRRRRARAPEVATEVVETSMATVVAEDDTPAVDLAPAAADDVAEPVAEAARPSHPVRPPRRSRTTPAPADTSSVRNGAAEKPARDDREQPERERPERERSARDDNTPLGFGKDIPAFMLKSARTG